MNPLRKGVAKALVWTIVESGGLSGVSLVALIAFARLLSPEQIGTAAIALGAVQLLNVPVEILFQDALIQRADVEEAHFDTAFTASLALSLVLTSVGWLSADLLARFVGVPEVGPVFAVMCLSLIPMGFSTVVVSRQRRDIEFRALAQRSLIGRVGGAAIGIAVSLYGGGVWGLVAQQVLMITLSASVLWVMSSHRPRLRFSWRHFTDLFGFGLRSVAVISLYIACQRIYILLVGAWLGPASAGYLNIAFRLVDMLREVVAGAVAQVSLPLFKAYQLHRDGLRRCYIEANSLTCLIGFPIFAGLAACAPEALGFLFGPQWAPSDAFVAILGFLVLPFFARIYVTQCMAAVGRPQAALPGQFVTLAFIVIGMATFGYKSITAAMTIWVARLILAVPLDAWMLRRVSGVDFKAQVSGVITPFVASLAMAGVVQAAKTFLLQDVSVGLRFAVSIVIGATVYSVMILVLDRPLVIRLLDFGRLALSRRDLIPSGTSKSV